MKHILLIITALMLVVGLPIYAQKISLIGVDRSEVQGVIDDFKEAVRKKEPEKEIKRKALIDIDKVEEIENFIQGEWIVGDIKACGIYSGGAEGDAKGIIGKTLTINGKKVLVPVSLHSRLNPQYDAGFQTCTIKSIKKIEIPTECKEDLGYLIESVAVEISMTCDKPNNIKKEDIYKETKFIRIADKGNVVLLSVWEVFVELRRKSSVEKESEKEPNVKVDGLYTYWYDNGQKWSEANWKDGKLEGRAALWYENGQKKKEINYNDGKLDGKWTGWYSNGVKHIERYMKMGSVISEECWDEDGNEMDCPRY